MNLDIVWRVIMPNMLIKINLGPSFSYFTFYPSAVQLAKSPKRSKSSDPCYGGKNESFDEKQDIVQVLYIKLYLKMSGNINFSKFWAFVGRSVPPLLGGGLI